jgi:zinc protease
VDAFADWKRQKEAAFEYERSDPESILRHAIDSLQSTGGRMRGAPAVALDRIRLDSVSTLYKERFSDISSFTFVIAGDFDVERMTKLCGRYLGSIPAGSRKATARHHKVEDDLCKSLSADIAFKGQLASSSVILTCGGYLDYSLASQFRVDMLNMYLRILLMNRLREVEGGTYDVAVHANPLARASRKYEIFISFRCLPGDVDRLVSATRQALYAAAKGGIDPQAVNQIKLMAKKDLTAKLNNSNFWLYYLADQNDGKRDYFEVMRRFDWIDQLKGETLQDWVSDLVSEKCISTFVLSPRQ